jgi:Flp pilus assembly pilin Flp
MPSIYNFCHHLSRQFAHIRGLVVKVLFVRFVKNDFGATATELGLIAAGISLSIIMIMLGLVTNH